MAKASKPRRKEEHAMEVDDPVGEVATQMLTFTTLAQRVLDEVMKREARRKKERVQGITAAGREILMDAATHYSQRSADIRSRIDAHKKILSTVQGAANYPGKVGVERVINAYAVSVAASQDPSLSDDERKDFTEPREKLGSVIRDTYGIEIDRIENAGDENTLREYLQQALRERDDARENLNANSVSIDDEKVGGADTREQKNANEAGSTTDLVEAQNDVDILSAEVEQASDAAHPSSERLKSLGYSDEAIYCQEKALQTSTPKPKNIVGRSRKRSTTKKYRPISQSISTRKNSNVSVSVN